VTIPSRGTPEFWRLYRALPAEARLLARKNYKLWTANAFHPSLHFKPVRKPNWSARVGTEVPVVFCHGSSSGFLPPNLHETLI
jgi:hypothetical protein